MGHHINNDSFQYMGKHVVTAANSTSLRMYAEVCQKQADMEHKGEDQYVKYNRVTKKTGRMQILRWTSTYMW